MQESKKSEGREIRSLSSKNADHQSMEDDITLS